MRPRVQLSGEVDHRDNYCAAVRAAGGAPLPGYCPAPDLECDGLLLCGGGDVDSALYGQENRGSDPPDLARDRAELALFRAFFDAGKPILGVCRGMQVMNVALGGDLIQDLPPEVLAFHGRAEQDLVHPVRAEEGSLLRRLYGPVFSVNSAHHQAVLRLGEGFSASAWAEGGFPEAVEHVSRPVMGVQFHPERMSFALRRPDTADGAPILYRFLALCEYK